MKRPAQVESANEVKVKVEVLIRSEGQSRTKPARLPRMPPLSQMTKMPIEWKKRLCMRHPKRVSSKGGVVEAWQWSPMMMT